MTPEEELPQEGMDQGMEQGGQDLSQLPPEQQQAMMAQMQMQMAQQARAQQLQQIDALLEQQAQMDQRISQLNARLAMDNIASDLTDEELSEIGRTVVKEFDIDLGSRTEWEKRYESALKLAAQVAENKSFPWPGAANVKYPLLTTACIQFSARAYPSLVPGTNIVKCKTHGQDKDGEKEKRAIRVSKHMSYQILEQMQDWEEDMDRLLVMLPITGTEFKKTYYNPSIGTNISEHVLARDLVVNYWAKSLETASRKSHIIYIYPNDILERKNTGVFLDVDFGKDSQLSRQNEIILNKIQGTEQPQDDDDAPLKFIEQHRFLDLDGDGYKEPYIVTVHYESQKVARIVARFDQQDIEYNDKKIIKITPIEHFTKYSFMPALDGGFYDTGWGLLLAPINEVINTTVNQLLDAGTLSNMQSGFLSKGIRLVGGDTGFTAGEWKTVQTTGDDLRKSIFPLPVQQPSSTLFNLLGTMIESGKEMVNLTDLLLGDSPGQNQPATTTMALIEQGQKVFTSVYKRLYRSLKKEFKKLYRLNKIFLDDKEYFISIDPGQEDILNVDRSDYHGDDNDIYPAADPNIVAETQKLARAEAIVQSMAAGAPVDPIYAWRYYFEALGIPAVDKLMNPPEPQPNPEIELEKVKLQLEGAKLQNDDKHNEMGHQIDMFKAETDRLKLEHDKQISGVPVDNTLEKNKAEAEFQAKGLELSLKEREVDIKDRDMALKEREMVLKEKELELEKLKIYIDAQIKREQIEATKEAKNAEQMRQSEEKESETESKTEEKVEKGQLDQVLKSLAETVSRLSKPKEFEFILDDMGMPIGSKQKVTE